MPIEKRIRWLVVVWLLVITMTCNLVVGGLLIWQRADSAEFTKCTATWQNDFFTAYSARTGAVAEKDKALDDLIIAVASEDRREFAQALAGYEKVRETQIAERKANPYPPLPRQACGTEEGGVIE